MDMLLGLLSLAGLSLFLARWMGGRLYAEPSATPKGSPPPRAVGGRSSSLTPLVAVSLAMLWFTLFGCLGLLQAGGWLWYALCLAALGWVIYKERRAVLRLVSPGFVFFVAGGAVFITLFFLTRPMLTQWDEFTFWGTAAKVTTEANQLYTTATSNLIARAYPPGIVVFNYMMQFFGGGFAEYKLIASYAVLYLAALAAPGAMWKKNRAGAVVFLLAMAALPLLFETGRAGEISWAYLSCMGDLPMAVLFGGALCLYFGGGKRDGKLMLAFFAVLAALTNAKDMGLALACVALFIALADMLFCQRKTLALGRLKGGAAVGAWAVGGFGVIALTYAGWLWHMATTGQNRANLGTSGGASFTAVDMLVSGIKATLRIQPSEVFDDRAAKMLGAFANGAEFPVWLFGSGLRLLVCIVAVLAAAWLLAPQKVERRRIVVFTASSVLGFAAFYLFNIFTYTYILKGLEAEILKDYHRYIFPFWFGWLMTALSLLAKRAGEGGLAPAAGKTPMPPGGWRGPAARGAALVAALAVLGGVALRFNYGANFANVSPSLYGQRFSVRQSLSEARQQGMAAEDVVYMISQGDDGTRFYMLCYEMDETLRQLYYGEREDGTLAGASAASFVAPGSVTEYQYPVECTPADLAAYLQQQGCTHLLVDMADDYIVQAFGPLFADGLAGWDEDGIYRGGPRYYRIQWQGGQPRFIPAQGEGGA